MITAHPLFLLRCCYCFIKRHAGTVGIKIFVKKRTDTKEDKKMSDLILQCKTGASGHDEDEECDDIILSNIQGQRYLLGSEYPGQQKGEEFIFCGNEAVLGDPVNPSHCVISVDRNGQYLIHNGSLRGPTTRSCANYYNTFVNSVRIKSAEKRLLQSGDIISLGSPITRWSRRRENQYHHPIYHVIIPSNPSGPNNAIEETPNRDGKESPMDNNLILANIMSFLSVKDLKNARLVCKTWNEEATKVLERKATTSFTLLTDYMNPIYSTKVARYIHEMRNLKISRIHINLLPKYPRSRGQPIQNNPSLYPKMYDDLRKLLNSSHNFTSLYLKLHIENEESFQLFTLILNSLGEKLTKLKLQGNLAYLPEDLPPFPKLRNVKKFTDNLELDGGTVEIKQKWVTHIVPLLSEELEHFSGFKYIAEYYFQQFLLQESFRNLREISIGNGSVMTETSLRLLLQLSDRNPLSYLKLIYYKCYSEPGMGCGMLEALLEKNATSLTNLVIEINNYSIYIGRTDVIDVRFPPLPNLKELKLELSNRTKISWGNGEASLDFRKQFGSLRKLEITLPQFWRGDEPILSSFLPFPNDDENDVKSETLKELRIVAPNGNPFIFVSVDREEILFQRIIATGVMFPNATNIDVIR